MEVVKSGEDASASPSGKPNNVTSLAYTGGNMSERILCV